MFLQPLEFYHVIACYFFLNLNRSRLYTVAIRKYIIDLVIIKNHRQQLALEGGEPESL